MRLEEISKADSPNKSGQIDVAKGSARFSLYQAGTAFVVFDPELNINCKMSRDKCIPATPTLEGKGIVHVYLVPEDVFEILQVIEVVSHTEIQIGRKRSPKLCKGQNGDVGVLAEVYALIVEVFIYRDIPFRRLPAIVAESMMLVGGILIILACALGLTNYLIDAEIPMQLLEWMQTYVSSKYTFLLLLNVFLLIVGCLMDIFSALIVVVPLIVPVAIGFGVDPVHLGIIFLTNLEIGYITPPVGLNLFISSYRFNEPVVSLYAASIPFLLLLLGALLVITYIPAISLFLVRLVGG